MSPSTVTGDALADTSQTFSGPLAFLEPEQRGALLRDGKDRWLAAEERLHAAILSVGLREAIRPDDPLPLWVTLLMDAAGIGLTVAAGHVAEGARERGTELLKDADVWVALGAKPTAKERALMVLAQASPVHVDAAIELGVGAGKESSLHAIEEGRTGDLSAQEKDVVLLVLDTFHDEAAVIFQHVREDVPAIAAAAGDDAALLTWFRLAKAEGPLTTAYFRQQIADKLARFRSAHLSEIGIEHSLLGMSHATERLQWREHEVRRRLAILEPVTDDGCEDDLARAEVKGWVPEEFEVQAEEISRARGAEVVGERAPAVPECEVDDTLAESVVPL